MDYTPVIIQAIVSVATIFGGAGFWQYLTAKQSRKSGLEKKVDAIAVKVDKLESDNAETKEHEKEKAAKDARRRILHFSDELENKVCHSKEYFLDILDDIDTYDRYCRTHPDFPNSRTIAAEQNIRDCYTERLAEHDFSIGGGEDE